MIFFQVMVQRKTLLPKLFMVLLCMVVLNHAQFGAGSSLFKIGTHTYGMG